MSDPNLAITSAVAEMEENTKIIGQRISEFTNVNQDFHNKLVDQMKQIVENINNLKDNPGLKYVHSYEDTAKQLNESQKELEAMTEKNTVIEKQISELQDQLQKSQENCAQANSTASAANTQLKTELEECGKKLQEAQQNLEKVQGEGTLELQEAKDQLSNAQKELIDAQNKQQQQVTEAQNAEKLAENQLADSQKKISELQNSLYELSKQIMNIKDQIKQQLDNINQMISNATDNNKNYDDNLLQITSSLKELMNTIANPPSNPVIPPNPANLGSSNGVIKNKGYTPLTNVKQLDNYQKYLKGGKSRKLKMKKRRKTIKNKKGGYNYSQSSSIRNSSFGKRYSIKSSSKKINNH